MLTNQIAKLILTPRPAMLVKEALTRFPGFILGAEHIHGVVTV